MLAYFSGCAYTRLRYGGSSSVGRAPGCGPGGRGFKSHLSPHKEIPPLSSGVFLFLPLVTARQPLSGAVPGARAGSPKGQIPALFSCARKGICLVRRGGPPGGPFPAGREGPGPSRVFPLVLIYRWSPVRGRHLPGERESPAVLTRRRRLFPQGRQRPWPPDGPPLPKQGLLRTKHPITERGAAW